jgi:uncharacterized UPF0146 family protein
MVENQLVINFSDGMIRSTSMTVSHSLMKFWTAPISAFITSETELDRKKAATKVEQPIINFDDDPIEDTIPETEEDTTDIDAKFKEVEAFDFYVSKGDVFRRFLSVFGSDSVNVTIDIDRTKNVATDIIIEGQSVNGTNLTSKFNLSSEDIIMNKVSDYSKVIEELTPKPDMQQFLISVEETKEIKFLIKQLHNTNVQNTTYIKFYINAAEQYVELSDEVFKLRYSLRKNEDIPLPTKDMTFNLFKTDLIAAGTHSFVFFSTDQKDDFVITNTHYKKCLISTIMSKSYEKNTDNNLVSTDIANADFDLDNMSEYFD